MTVMEKVKDNSVDCISSVKVSIINAFEGGRDKAGPVAQVNRGKLMSSIFQQSQFIRKTKVQTNPFYPLARQETGQVGQ